MQVNHIHVSTVQIVLEMTNKAAKAVKWNEKAQF